MADRAAPARGTAGAAASSAPAAPAIAASRRDDASRATSAAAPGMGLMGRGPSRGEMTSATPSPAIHPLGRRTVRADGFSSPSSSSPPPPPPPPPPPRSLFPLPELPPSRGSSADDTTIADRFIAFDRAEGDTDDRQTAAATMATQSTAPPHAAPTITYREASPPSCDEDGEFGARGPVTVPTLQHDIDPLTKLTPEGVTPYALAHADCRKLYMTEGLPEVTCAEAVCATAAATADDDANTRTRKVSTSEPPPCRPRPLGW
jgi:hypothetical protein